MKQEMRYALALIGLGAGLVAYAHTTFATKGEVDSVSKMVYRIDKRVYELIRSGGHTDPVTKENQ